ncbi:hypothetical protein Hypma_004237 [Hypsizygus marmoreus]|uniref:Uncharacterized protein n=1 Tax=Hypsizygus marmoreus TaxID=39966 RepID=A0A369J4V8_HYPMA|nr:hypothetical protein Hypma_004237 [Hypsizygus marmoreus]
MPVLATDLAAGFFPVFTVFSRDILTGASSFEHDYDFSTTNLLRRAHAEDNDAPYMWLMELLDVEGVCQPSFQPCIPGPRRREHGYRMVSEAEQEGLDLLRRIDVRVPGS